MSKAMLEPWLMPEMSSPAARAAGVQGDRPRCRKASFIAW